MPGKMRKPVRGGFCCPHCFLAPHCPVTGPCGHTSCLQCAELDNCCPCGEQYYERLSVDVLVQKLMTLVIKASISPNEKLDSGRVLKPRRTVLQPFTLNRYLNGPSEATCDGNVKWKPIHFSALSTCLTLKRRLRSELVCPVCSSQLWRPVCTPCGHTFCRPCLERTLDYQTKCPLCKHSLADFNIDVAEDSEGVRLALRGFPIPAKRCIDPADTEVPLFLCTVAYPGVPCPLRVVEPRYRTLLRRVMRSPSRLFGMMPPPCAECRDLPGVGTLLELRDVVRLRDGSSIITTVGVCRFRVAQRHEHEQGYSVASVHRLCDVPPLDYEGVSSCGLLLCLLEKECKRWLESLSSGTRRKIVETYGLVPAASASSRDDGPVLCWWVVAIIPYELPFKVKMLGSTSPEKRLWLLTKALREVEVEESKQEA